MKTILDTANVNFDIYKWVDLISFNLTRHAIQENKSTVVKRLSFILPDNFDFDSWIKSKTSQFNFVNFETCILFMPFGVVIADYNRASLVFRVYGEMEGALRFIDDLKQELKQVESSIDWFYDANGSSVSLPLSCKEPPEGVYPWISKSLSEYAKDYLQSESNVLILIGPPGTGKTTFIKQLIKLSGGSAMVTYDPSIMNQDSLFASFIEGDKEFLVLEDSDAFLEQRENGNLMMHRFLNVSDGLVSSRNKKIIFSTNLPSISNIDSALMRPGRCFDVLEFRPLTRSEATVVAEKAGIELPDGNSFTLAELFNKKQSVVRRKVGFTC